MNSLYESELIKAFETIQNHDLDISVVICSECGCTLTKNNKQPPCEHFKKIAEDLEAQENYEKRKNFHPLNKLKLITENN